MYLVTAYAAYVSFTNPARSPEINESIKLMIDSIGKISNDFFLRDKSVQHFALTSNVE